MTPQWWDWGWFWAGFVCTFAVGMLLLWWRTARRRPTWCYFCAAGVHSHNPATGQCITHGCRCDLIRPGQLWQ